MREFLKNISIYGLLPVLGKFLGFFLIPVYARVFSTDQFGIVELFVVLVSFLVFGCNLEMYSSIGRYFYEKSTLHERKILISTGLSLTLISTSIVCILVFIFEDFFYINYFETYEYKNIFRISVIWLFLNAISTYLSIIPRYEKRPTIYVIVNFTSLLIRICSTILFVLGFKVGIIGVIYGHICGDLTSVIFNGIISRKYLGFYCKKEYISLILSYALPLVPGLLIVGLWNPLSRNLMNMFYSVSVVGLFAFANRFTAINSIFSGALRNTWQPLLFENIKNPNFETQIKKISGLCVFLTLGFGIVLTIFANELCIVIGTEAYAESSIFVGFLCLSGTFGVLTQIRGFGPLVINKTYIYSVFDIINFVCSIALFYLLNNRLGMVGLGIIFLFNYAFNYLLLSEYTRRKMKIKFYNSWEIYFLIYIVFAEVSNILNFSLMFRVVLCITFFIMSFYVIHKIGGFIVLKNLLIKKK